MTTSDDRRYDAPDGLVHWAEDHAIGINVTTCERRSQNMWATDVLTLVTDDREVTCLRCLAGRRPGWRSRLL